MAEPNDSETRTDEPEPPPFYKRPLPLIGSALLVALVAVGGLLWWLHARQYASTDDAFIDAHTTRVAPRVAGQVLAVRVQDNQWVEEGATLVEIDPAAYEARLKQAEAGKDQAEARLAEAKAQLEVANANTAEAQAQVSVADANAGNARDQADRLERLTGLTSSSNLAVSQQSLEDAQAAARSSAAQLEAARKRAAAVAAQAGAAKSQIQSAEAAVESAGAQLRQARLDLSYAEIAAPVAGRVTNRSVEVGDYVEPGQALLALVPKDVWVTANFKETALGRIRPGPYVSIAVDAYPDRELDGRVESIQAGTGASFALLPPQNATGNYVKVVQRVPVKITFDAIPDDLLLAPGMSVVPTVKVR